MTTSLSIYHVFYFHPHFYRILLLHCIQYIMGSFITNTLSLKNKTMNKCIPHITSSFITHTFKDCSTSLNMTVPGAVNEKYNHWSVSTNYIVVCTSFLNTVFDKGC